MKKKPNSLEPLARPQRDKITTILEHQIRRSELIDLTTTAYQNEFDDHEAKVLSVTVEPASRSDL